MVRLRQESGGATDGLRNSVDRDDSWLDSDRGQERLRMGSGVAWVGMTHG